MVTLTTQILKRYLFYINFPLSVEDVPDEQRRLEKTRIEVRET